MHRFVFAPSPTHAQDVNQAPLSTVMCVSSLGHGHVQGSTINGAHAASIGHNTTRTIFLAVVILVFEQALGSGLVCVPTSGGTATFAASLTLRSSGLQPRARLLCTTRWGHPIRSKPKPLHALDTRAREGGRPDVRSSQRYDYNLTVTST